MLSWEWSAGLIVRRIQTGILVPVWAGWRSRLATSYGLGGPGIESRWGRDFSTPVQAGPEAHPASCTMGTGSFPGVKSGRGLTLTPSRPSSAVGHERVELYLYSPCGPYGLYRASVPVHRCTLPFYYIGPCTSVPRLKDAWRNGNMASCIICLFLHVWLFFYTVRLFYYVCFCVWTILTPLQHIII